MNWSHFFADVTLTLLPFGVAAATALLGKATQYALHAVAGLKNRQLRDGLDWAIQEADTVAKQVVVALNQTVVNGLKQSGQWDATAAAKVFRQALDTIDTQLSTKAQALLEQELPNLVQWLGTLIEAHVATAPNKITVAPKA